MTPSMLCQRISIRRSLSRQFARHSRNTRASVSASKTTWWLLKRVLKSSRRRFLRNSKISRLPWQNSDRSIANQGGHRSLGDRDLVVWLKEEHFVISHL